MRYRLARGNSLPARRFDTSRVGNLAVLGLFIAACTSAGGPNRLMSTEAAKETRFATMMPNVSLMGALHVSAPSQMNTFKADAPITLVIENVSRDFIWLPKDDAPRAYAYSGTSGSWLLVPNLMKYVKSDERLHPAGGGLASTTITTVLPNVIPIDGHVAVRILVIGFVDKRGAPTSIAVGGYTDVSLTP